MQVKTKVDQYLREHEDGATIPDISRGTGAKLESVRAAVKVMPHIYIDRWTAVQTGHRYEWVAVYARVATMDAVKPDRLPAKEDVDFACR